MSDEVKITGFADIERALKNLPDAVQNRVTKSMLRAGARVVVLAARQNLPGNYGTLKRSIATKIVRQRRSGNLTALVGAKKEGWYAHIVEFGTLGSRAEPLSPKTRRQRKYKKGLPEGLKPHPFLRPALDENKAEIMRAIQQKFYPAMEREAKRLRR